MKKSIWVLLLLGILQGGVSAAEVAAAPVRVISLSPALTELICHLGGESLLVARSRACDRPASVTALPVAGDFGVPELERVVAVRPDVLVVDTLQTETVRATLEDLGVAVMVLPLRNFAEYRGAVTALGRRLGLQAAATRELERLERTLEEYRQELRSEELRQPFWPGTWRAEYPDQWIWNRRRQPDISGAVQYSGCLS